MFLVAIGPEIPLQEVLVVLDEHPEHRGHAVGEECEHVLEPVNRLERCVRAQPDKRRDLEVLVVATDIGVCMVDGVVGNLPDIAVGAERVEEAADQPIDARVGRIGAMQGIVGDRETDPGHADTHNEAQQPHPRQRQQAADDQAVRPEVQGDEHHRLGDHRRIGVPRQPVLFEIVYRWRGTRSAAATDRSSVVSQK